MLSTLSDTHREDIWAALSDAFIDNEVNYEFIARRVAGVARADLEHIFFTEVVPECAFNVFAVIPPVWAAFDRKGLAECIRDMQARNRRSVLARLKHRVAVAFYRVCFRSYWEQIEAELERKGA